MVCPSYEESSWADQSAASYHLDESGWLLCGVHVLDESNQRSLRDLNGFTGEDAGDVLACNPFGLQAHRSFNSARRAPVHNDLGMQSQFHQWDLKEIGVNDIRPTAGLPGLQDPPPTDR